MDVPNRFEEDLAHPGAVHGIVGAGTALDLLRQAARAHGVGASEQVGGDLGQRNRLHHAEATARRGHGTRSGPTRRLVRSSTRESHAHRHRVGSRRFPPEGAPQGSAEGRRPRRDRSRHRFRRARRLPADLRGRRQGSCRGPRRAGDRARWKRARRADLREQGARRTRRAVQRPVHRRVLATPQRRERALDRCPHRRRGSRRRDPCGSGLPPSSKAAATSAASTRSPNSSPNDGNPGARDASGGESTTCGVSATRWTQRAKRAESTRQRANVRGAGTLRRRERANNLGGYLLVGGVAAGVTFLLTFAMRWLAPRVGAMAMPGRAACTRSRSRTSVARPCSSAFSWRWPSRRESRSSTRCSSTTRKPWACCSRPP